MTMAELPANSDLEALGQKAEAHLGDPSAEYAALTSSAGLVDMSERTRIELTGADRASFLHNLCTNEIKKRPAGAGCEAFLLDARGHVVAHLFIVCRSDSLILETVAGQEDRLLAHLDRYLIRERVAMRGRSADWGELLLAGPDTPQVVAKVARRGAGGEGTGNREQGTEMAAGAWQAPTMRLAHDDVSLAGRLATLVRVELTRPFGFLIFCQREDMAKIWQSLAEAGARPCGHAAFETARVEAGFPLYGGDISDKNLPQEVNRTSLAISFVKGCYLGQETVARIDALGHVNRTLGCVRFFNTSVPAAGTELTAAGHPVGQVTSAVFSPRMNAPLALAYLRRGSDAPGIQLDSMLGCAEVVTL
jgi:folate-binding protein YgfZ